MAVGDGGDERRSGGETVFMRIILDRPPDATVLWEMAGAVRATDEVISPWESTVTSPGFEIEVILKGTSAAAVAELVLPRVQDLLRDRTVRLVQIDGEDIVVNDA